MILVVCLAALLAVRTVSAELVPLTPVPRTADVFGVGFSPTVRDSMYLPDETPGFSVAVTNTTGRPVELTLDCKTIDYFGKTILTRCERLMCADGEVSGKTVSYPELKRPGYYCTTVKWAADGRTGSAECSFVNVAQPPAKPDRLFGITAFAANEPERFRRLGVGTKAVFFSWKRLDDGKGGLRLEEVADEIVRLRANGIRVVGHFVAVNGSETPRRYLRKTANRKEDPIADPAKYYADYGNFVRTIVKTFGTDIRDWGATAEINLLAFAAPYLRQRYVDLVRVISESIRSTDSSAHLTGIGCSGGDGQEKPRYRFLRSILPSVSEYIDGFGIDQYTRGQTYGEGFENQDSEQAELREMMLTALDIARKDGKGMLAIDEKGPSILRKTPFSSLLGSQMANVVARDFIILKTVPEVIHWLYFRPTNWNPKSFVDYGMWDRGWPRQTVAAYAATARQMAGAEFVAGKRLHRDIVCWMFRQDGRFLATLWYNGAKPLGFAMPKDMRAEVTDVQGNPVAVRDGRLELSAAPLYLRSGTREELDRIIGSASYSVPELEATAFAAAAGRATVAVRNLGGVTRRVRVREAASAGVLTLEPDEVKSATFDCAGGEGPFTVESDSGEVSEADGSLRTVGVPRVRGWDDLGDAPELHLTDPGRQAPGFDDLRANRLYAGPGDLSAVVRIGYDDTRFYVSCEVTDDAHVNDQAPGRSFRQDSVQFIIDACGNGRLNGLKGVCGLDDDDYNFVSALADGKPFTYCFNAAAENRARTENAVVGETQVVRDETRKLTCYRIFLPFADLAPLKPEKGRVFGFSIVVTDSDPGESKTYWIEATPGVCGIRCPAKYLQLVFE